VTDVEVRM